MILKNNFNYKKILKYIFVALLVIIFLIILYSLINIKNIIDVYKYSISGKQNITDIQQDLKDQNFDALSNNLTLANNNFSAAYQAINSIKLYSYFPYIGTQYKAANHLLKAGVDLTDASANLAILGKDITEILKNKDDEISYANISKKKKEAILKKLYESPDLINESLDKINSGVEELDQIPKKGLISPLQNNLDPIIKNIPDIKHALNQITPLVEILPPLLGYPEKKTYLFLLQNNTELRPTGGFIGTYGILKLNAGDMEIETDNIYNLDYPVKDTLSIEPPEPIIKYLNQQKWFLRDSNWSPDFVETAKKAEEFYFLENGKEKNINGVIAITPTVIQNFLKLTGPVKAQGEEFNYENFIDKLQYIVEFGYRTEGISDSARKDVISEMSQILMAKVLDTPKNKWFDLWKIVAQMGDEKQLLFYLKDQALEKYTKQLNWDGEIADKEYTGRDYLFIVDANLAAKKTDKVMERSYNYSVTLDKNNNLIANLTLVYKNNGIGYGEITTRYRTYTRIYVPYGSELISSTGFLTDDLNNWGQPVQAFVKQDNEYHKTIFEGFIAIEPQDQVEVTLQYKLPKEISDLYKNNKYNLIWQKQGGMPNNYLNISLNFDKQINNATALDLNSKINNNNITISGLLSTDRQINIKF